MRKIGILLMASLLVVGTACKTKKSTKQDTSLLAGVERSYCFGKCPVYSFLIYADGKVSYEGIANVEKIGKFEGTLPMEEIEKIIEAAKEMDFSLYNKVYKVEGVQDLPSITTYFKEFKIEDTGGLSPKTLRDFQEYLDTLYPKVIFK